MTKKHTINFKTRIIALIVILSLFVASCGLFNNFTNQPTETPKPVPTQTLASNSPDAIKTIQTGLRGGDQSITINGYQVVILSWHSIIKIFLISMI